MLAVDALARGAIGSDDFAANVASVDLDLLQSDAVAMPAGVEDLNEFAVLQWHVARFRAATSPRATRAASGATLLRG